MPERVRSDRRIEDVTPASRNRRTGGSADNAAIQAADAVQPPADPSPKMNPESGGPERRRHEGLVGAAQLYPHAAATALAMIQALALLPFRSLQSWQEAWLGLLLRKP